MSNSFRNKKTNTPRKDVSQTKGEKAEQLTIDLRWEKDKYLLVIGVLLMALAVLLFIAFLSYLFTGETDQDLIQRDLGTAINQSQKKASNLLGILGAYTSHWFVFQWFGLAAFGWLPIVFWAGYRLFTKKDLFPINFNHFTIASVFYTFWTSMFLGYWVVLFQIGTGKISGGFGFAVNEYFERAIGWAGIVIILIMLFAWLVFFHGYTKIDDYFFARFLKSNINEDEEEDVATERIQRVVKDAHTFVDNDVPESPHPDMLTPINDLLNKKPIVSLEITPPTKEEKAAEPEELKTTVKNGPFKGGITFEIEDTTKKLNDELTLEVANTPEDLHEDDVDFLNEKALKDFGLYDSTLDLPHYKFPTVELLSNYDQAGGKVTEDELEANKNKIVETMRNFQIGIASIKATIGPTVTLYEIVPEAGVRISKIKNLEDDIALNLAALGIRIIAPMPGKGTIGIEVPNKNREMVSMKSVISSEKFQKSNFELPTILGKTISNEIFITDLAKMPHLLMAGATGQGKSVGINVILASLLYKKHPSQLKFVLVDPKKVELTLYTKIERHFLAMLPNAAEAIITDTKKVIYTLNSLCIEMDNRYNLLKDAGVRNIKEYNAKFVHRRLNPEKGHRYLPYIVLVIDELADLMMTAGKEVEQPIARLAQLARAIGIHLVVATQRPSVNVITGLIKANFPARLSFKVTSKIDSRTILDTGGSEQLVGNGDMLLSMGSDMVRLQCPFVDTHEVEEICEFIGSQKAYESAYLLPEFYGDEESETLDFDPSELDAMFEDAARLLVTHQQGSTSLIQRKMKLGYNRAGRIIDQLEAAGIVGPFEGSKAREVLIKDLEHLEQLLRDLRN